MIKIDRMLDEMSIADLEVVIKIASEVIESGIDAKYWAYICTEANINLGNRLIPLMKCAKKAVRK